MLPAAAVTTNSIGVFALADGRGFSHVEDADDIEAALRGGGAGQLAPATVPA